MKKLKHLTKDFMLLPFGSKAQQAMAEMRKYSKGLYADRPGTGPAGETCGSCKNRAFIHLARVYSKCGLMRHQWTGGGGTDVKVRAPACSKWEREDAGV